MGALGPLRILRALLGAASAFGVVAQAAAPAAMPRPDHVVIVIEENKSYRQIINNMAAPYINSLANAGALFTRSFGIAHPSQPNYLALFSGSTHGVPDNRCPVQLRGDNLASALRAKSLSFAIFSESMPAPGYEGCEAGNWLYARKHNPAVNWQRDNLPPDINLPFERFPSDYSRLPTVAMVIPNQLNDMHNDEVLLDAIQRADQWLKTNLDAYVQWAGKNNSLLILTFDEDDDSSGNQIVTLFVGPMVKRGRYAQRIDHYNVLRTLEEMYGLPLLGNSARAAPIRDVWKTLPAPRQ